MGGGEMIKFSPLDVASGHQIVPVSIFPQEMTVLIDAEFMLTATGSVSGRRVQICPHSTGNHNNR